MWTERLAHDVRYAVRVWSATPGLSIVAVLTIAMGIGASTAIVGQINAVFWTRLAVPQPEALREVAWAAPRFPFVSGGRLNVIDGPRIDGTATFGSFSYAAYEAMRDGTTQFSDLACWRDFGEARPVTLGELGFGAVQFASGNYFRMLGVRAAIGRTIEPDDDGPETWAPVAIIGHRFWQRVFGGDPTVTSKTITLNGRVFAIVGVIPATFSGLDPASTADVVLPMGAAVIAAQTANPLRNRGIWVTCRVVGRLRADASEEQAQLEIERAVAASIAAAPPTDPYDAPRLHLTDGSHGLSTLRAAASAPLAILLASVGALLLAACANIAGLLLARGSAREREIATRLALGAPRVRIVRQLVTESLLSSIGGFLGVALAFALSERAGTLLSQFMPTLFGADRTLTLTVGPDWRVMSFALVATIGSGLLFGIIPALRATRLDLITAIRQVKADAGRRKWTTGRLLVSAQTALAVVLMVGSGLFLRTLVNLRSADLGFAADRLLYARVEPRSANLPPGQRAQFFEQTVSRLARLPGVVAASAATSLPFGGETNVGSATLFVCPAGGAVDGREPVAVTVSSIAPDYFKTLGVDFLAGRDLIWADGTGNPPRVAIVINEALAQKAFGLNNAIDQRLFIAPDCRTAGTPASGNLPVVGVVRDIRSDSRTAPMPTIYWPLAFSGLPTTLLVRTNADPTSMIATVRRAVTEINADIPTFSEAPLTTLRERALRRERLLSTLLSLFATVTVLVSALGIYGLLAYDVTRRRAEIGIRMAIGADARAVIRLIARDSLAAVVAGVAVGLTAAVAAHWALRSMFYGVSLGEPIVLISAAAVFLVVAAAAAALPARSAVRVDPVQSLRL
jgi:predicted permease